MKIIVTLAGLAVIGVLAFQNCNKRPAAVDEISGKQEALVSRIDMSMADLSKISFYVPGVDTVTKAGHTYSLKYNKTISIDMQTDIISETNDANNTKRTFCLPADMKSELAGILEGSQICKWGNTSGPGVMCGMAMQLPYAELSMKDEIMGLGSATDTCGNNAVGLCDSRDEVLKAYIEKLNAAYTGYLCN